MSQEDRYRTLFCALVREVKLNNGFMLSALKTCVREMSEAAPMLDCFPDDYGDAIRDAEQTIAHAKSVDAWVNAIEVWANTAKEELL